MKISIGQLNYHIGNFERNLKLMNQAIDEALSQGSDLIVFSELSVCGYPPLDLLEHKEFIDSCMDSVLHLAERSHEIAIVAGGPSVNPAEKGKMLYNTAFFLNKGQIQYQVRKTLLPTYDIFDEYRYFEPNRAFEIVEFKGFRFALTICEDLWDDQPVDNAFAQTRLYIHSPMEELIKFKPDAIINISASPFAANKLDARRAVISQNAKKYQLPVFYANQVGAHAELIFDGGSMVVRPDGQVQECLPPFEEGVETYVLENRKINTNIPFELPERNLSEEFRLEMIYKALIFGVKDYFGKNGFSRATLGLSGGIDSALTLVIAAEALGAENIHVLMLPSRYSSDHSVSDSELLIQNLRVQSTLVAIQPVVGQVEEQLADLFAGTTPGLAEENIQARVRGLLLMALSNKKGHILLNTSNKSETAVGYSTLYGDLNGGLSVLGDLYKTDVYKLSGFINRNKEVIPNNILKKEPSAELRPGQKDSDSLPPYEVLDRILYAYIEQRMSLVDIAALGFDLQLVENVVSMVNRSEFKRFQAPPILRISSKAFGMGRRIPLVAKY